MVRLIVVVALALVLLTGTRAAAHDFSAGVLALVERDDGRFELAWTEPVDSLGAPAGVEVIFPEGCSRDVLLTCAGGLSGELRFSGMHASRMQVVVTVRWRDGSRFEAMATGEEPVIRVAATRSPAMWIGIGIEHILTGPDHLAFVIGLLLVIGLRRALVAAITAFTVAHSTTLLLAVTGALSAPAGVVEAAIGASVLLVAREAIASDRDGGAETVTRRWPWLVALLFGLVHGLGFAGALAELGYRTRDVGWPLLWFNVGVELGQLACLAVLVSIAAVGRRVRRRMSARRDDVARPALEARLRRVASYAIGSLGAYWCIERTLTLVSAAVTGSQ